MKGKILVVDDSRMVRQQVGRALTGAGFQVIEAQDGLEALDALAASPDTKLVVCDVTMPRMGGIDFLERVAEGGSTIPVVVLTTEGQPELMDRAKELGAKGWLVKPFKPELLLAVARRLVPAA